MRIIKYITIWTIIIGVMGYAINYIWPNTITFLQPITTHPMPNFNMQIQTFNFHAWFENLSIAANKQTKLTLDMPTRTWISDPGLFEIFEMIANNLALILDYMILAINVAIFPFRLIAYIVQLVMAFVGLNVNTPDSAFKWLFDLIDWFINRLQIPYV